MDTNALLTSLAGNALLLGIAVAYHKLTVKNLLTDAEVRAVKIVKESIDDNNKDFSDILKITIENKVSELIHLDKDVIHGRINEIKERTSRLEYGQAATEKELGKMTTKIESIQQELRIIEKSQDKTHGVVEGIRDRIGKVFESIDSNNAYLFESMDSLKSEIIKRMDSK